MKQPIRLAARLLLGLALVAAVVGCPGEATVTPADENPTAVDKPVTPPTEPPITPQTNEPTEPVDEPPQSITGQLGDPVEGSLLPAPKGAEPGGLGTGVEVDLIPSLPEPELPSRERRRMDIDQLNAALLSVSGGVTWTVGNKNQFEELSRTLGKPDYLDLTNEDLEPGALFTKFLDDAARSVCTATIANDLNVLPGDRVILGEVPVDATMDTDAPAIDANLRALLFRFHGRKVGANSPQMDTWRWLWTSAEHVSSDPVAAWKTVCIGLINHPEFYTY